MTGEDSDRVTEQLERLWWEAGFSQSDTGLWRAAAQRVIPTEEEDFTPTEHDFVRVASRWCIAGFSPSDAAEWCDRLEGSEDWEFLAQAARKWREAGFSAEQAGYWGGSVWPSPGTTVEGAVLFRDAGWWPLDLWLLKSFRVSDGGGNAAWAALPREHALNCARAGMTASEAAERVGWPSADLEPELRRRYLVRRPISSYLAMHINHHIWLSFDTEIPHDAPFYAERLWDLHDEDDAEARRKGRTPPTGGPYAIKPSGLCPAPDVCPGSRGQGTVEVRDGEYVVCPACGMWWTGSSEKRLPDHVRQQSAQ